MFLEKYLSDIYLDIIYSNYEKSYLNTLDEENFKEVYNVFKKYNFYFVDDIILNYLEIFELDSNEIEERLLNLRDRLGNNFNYVIGNDMKYLNELLD